MKLSTYQSKVSAMAPEEQALTNENLQVVKKLGGFKDDSQALNAKIVSSSSVYSLLIGTPYKIKNGKPCIDTYNGNEFYFYELEGNKRITAKSLFSKIDINDCVFSEEAKKGYLSVSDKEMVSKAEMLEIKEALLALTKRTLQVTYLGKTESASHDWDNKLYTTVEAK